MCSYLKGSKRSDQDYEISEDRPVEYYPIQNITAFFGVTEIHNHSPEFSEDCYSLINIQHFRIFKTKPASGNIYTSGASFIKPILMNDIEDEVNLDTGES
ncbi:hypothetical protein O181_062302 [Austropuccinia psidii MF-1]|uniref:Uncharacterized protein n=1 Tax=Austropuccinia psidii MF-1 TaxID=1389203 RepID=A0A9Q3ERZ6_9BASI|nr:hypothetical protein [Austropuccinia psidii MF-1]